MPVRTSQGLKLTYEDYVSIPEDGRRHEIVDGEHVVSPAPTPSHQKVSRWIQYQLFERIERPGLGQVIYAPIDVHLSQFDLAQPDLVVVMDARAAIVGAKKIDGAPDLVVEVLSPGTRHRDRGKKLRMYERNRVPEYWIVDPVARCVERFALGRDAAYSLTETAHRDIAPRCAPQAVVDLEEVWRRAAP